MARAAAKVAEPGDAAEQARHTAYAVRGMSGTAVAPARASASATAFATAASEPVTPLPPRPSHRSGLTTRK